MKCSVAFVSARPSEEVAGREERRTMIGHVWSEGSTEACGGTRFPRGSLTRLKSQKWWRESWTLPGDAESWPLRTLLCRRERAACRGRTPLPEGEGRVSWRTPLLEGEGRVSWADSADGGRGPSVVGGLRCRRERAECRQNILLPGGEPSVVREEIDGQGWEKIPTREKWCKLVVELFLRGEVM